MNPTTRSFHLSIVTPYARRFACRSLPKPRYDGRPNRRRWRLLRWFFLLAGVPFALWACTSHPLSQPAPSPGIQTDAEVIVKPIKQLDLLFMIDNSNSMESKQQKMKEQFPRLIEALRDPSDKTLPDLRVAIVDSDLGSGASGASTKCGRPGYGDHGKFQMRDPGSCGVADNAQWLQFTHNKPDNFEGSISDVFGCIAGKIGTGGCGYEHQLGAIHWAFYLKDNEKQLEFIRPNAYLGIVLLTDEDDCSAPHDTLMFEAKDPGSSTSLRCATRGHTCGKTPVTYPTTDSVIVPYASCHARTDETCDSSKVDTSQPTDCNPLLDIKKIADDIKKLKGDEADDKILVAAIYGTPLANDHSAKAYKIDKVARDKDSSDLMYEYWPICLDPEVPAPSSGYDIPSARRGATGGLRIDAFLGEFKKENSLAYSICERDFGPAMAGIGNRLIKMMENLCVPYKLVDTSPEPGIQGDCSVAYRRPVQKTNSQGKTVTTWMEDPNSIPPCDEKHTTDCWRLRLGNPNGNAEEKATAEQCKPTAKAPSQMVYIVRSPETDLPDGTKAVMHCLSCPDLEPGFSPTEGCDY
jgi:hypothetical protein